MRGHAKLSRKFVWDNAGRAHNAALYPYQIHDVFSVLPESEVQHRIPGALSSMRK
jgi:hypothetical protein